MQKLILFISFITLSFSISAQNYRLKGVVYDSLSNKILPGCNIFVNSLNTGTASEENGEYVLKLPYGEYEIIFSYVGYKSERKLVSLGEKRRSVRLDVYLLPISLSGEEVTVTAASGYSSASVQKLDEVEIKNMPRLYDDVLRTVKILPGVTSNNELSSGYNVRGGNFNENLIYLNGYEIYRPFLLQKGVEENQSLINPDLTTSYNFFNGSFPARLGDKMSSAIEIKYEGNNINITRFRADLLNAGISNRGSIGNLSWAAGLRYSYPFILQDQLQTTGLYKPEFRDIQILTKYSLNNNSYLEFFGVSAFNKYKLLPREWVGHFRSDRGAQVNALTLKFQGKNNYIFETNLAGIKYIYSPDSTFRFTYKTSFYSTKEEELKDQFSDIFYSPDAGQPEYGREYIKTRFENKSNFISLERIQTGFDFQKVYNSHVIRGGAELNIINYSDKRNENIYETGSELMYDSPYAVDSYKEYDLNSISAYVEDEITISENLFATMGLRISRYDYNEETLLSPRINLEYHYSNLHNFSFSWGYYSQPPFFYELKNKSPKDKNKLLAQKAVHYVLAWQYKFKEKVNLLAELYYKDLSRLIPFYIEQMKLEYLDENTSEGYAFGLDLLVQGEIDPGMQSWIGYSYLDTRERQSGTIDWKRRILDQTHTIQIYIQDRIDRHPNWQSHLRLLFGSGYLFCRRETLYDDEGIPYIGINYNNREEYLFYMRADMGLSASFDLGDGYEIMITAEVMNVFNNYNFAGYEWIQVFRDYEHPIRIPQIFSKRFYNLKINFSF